MKKLLFPLLVISFLLLSSTKSALAYLDAGTGSQVLQMAIAGIVGGLFAAKIFFKEIKRFFQKLFKKNG